jgi:eukaryotic-like serine/threonine-protein kinase
VQDKAQDDDLIMSIVEEALAVPAGDCRAFVQKACGGDEALFQRVWHYVELEHRMEGFLVTPVFTLPSNETPFKPGDLLDGRFRIVREVARGGMGIVFEARDERLHRRIALKCAKPGFHKRLPPEVRNASEISHPNVCKIFEIHTAHTGEGDVDFITMEFLDGETLSEKLTRGLSKAQAQTIARQICAGLAEAHRNNVVHGDLKGNNIIVTTGADGSLRAVITDFGLARETESAQQTRQSGPAAGTPAYMAPELWKGQKASKTSDVYALGVILFEMSVRDLERRSSTTWVDMTHVQHVRRGGIRGRWHKIISRCLDPEPSRRFQDGAEIAHALTPSLPRRLLFVSIAAAIVLAIISSVVTYERAKPPSELLRLAVLPFETDVQTKPTHDGVLGKVGILLSGVKPGRARLSVISLNDVLRKKINRPVDAGNVLGATHSLSGSLREENGRIVVNAYLTDSRSLVQLAAWRSDYDRGEIQNIPVALAGMVTSSLRLTPIVTAANVNAVAYPDYTAGRALARKDPDLDRAIVLLDRAVTADPNSPLTYAALGEAQFSKYLITDDPQWKAHAWTSLKKAEQRNPDLAAVHYVAGLIYDDEGQYEQAVADFQRAIELEPRNGDAWRRLGKTYEHNNQANLAQSAYLRAIEVQPDYFKNYRDLGAFYFTRDEYEEAATQYKKMIVLVPDLAVAHYQLATPYLDLGRYDEAEKELKAALSIEETVFEVEGFGLLRLYQDNSREAIPYLERALEIGPKSSVLYLNLGTAYRRSNLLKDAREAYQNGLFLAEARLSTNPRDAFEKSCLAYLCARLGDRRRAEAETAQALQLARGANNVRWMAALTYEAMGLHDRTMTVIEDAPESLLRRMNRFPDLADLRSFSRFKELMENHHIQ